MATKSSDPNRGLRLVVISMGLVLIAGTILLFVLAFQKMEQKAQAPDQASIPRIWRDCGAHQVALADNEHIERITFDEDGIMRVISRARDNQWQVRFVHPCSGEVVGKVVLTQPK